MSLRCLYSLALSICLLAVWPVAGHAHSNGKSILTLSPGAAPDASWSAHWDVSFRDLDLVLDLDRDLDGRLTRAEYEQAGERFADLPSRQLLFSVAGEPCLVDNVTHAPVQKPGTTEARLMFQVHCPDHQAALMLNYQMLADADSSHRVVVNIAGTSQIVSPGNLTSLLDTDAQPVSRVTEFAGFVSSGVEHILLGWDHLAFLLALLIPIWLASDGHRQAARHWRTIRLVQVITAFTVAHSFTLVLAVLQVVSPPAGPVEILIAASVVFAALVGIVNKAGAISVPMASLFGLLHGFGFADVMLQSGHTGWSIAADLFAFNLGVEIGQLLFVIVLLPLFWLLARTQRIATFAAPVISAALVVVGGSWLIDRILAGVSI